MKNILLLQKQLDRLENKFKCAKCNRKAQIYLRAANRIKQRINKLKQETV